MSPQFLRIAAGSIVSLVLIILLVGSFGSSLTGNDQGDEAIAPVKSETTGTRLQVRPPSGEALQSSHVQGAQKSQQQSRGGLQKSQTGESLQPNAKIPDFSSEL